MIKVIKNFTPHAVNICDKSGNIVNTIKSEGIVRLKTTIVSEK